MPPGGRFPFGDNTTPAVPPVGQDSITPIGKDSIPPASEGSLPPSVGIPGMYAGGSMNTDTAKNIMGYGGKVKY